MQKIISCFHDELEDRVNPLLKDGWKVIDLTATSEMLQGMSSNRALCFYAVVLEKVPLTSVDP